MKYARKHYRKRGELTSEYTSIVHALKFVKPAYGRTMASQFGPLAQLAVMEKMIEADLARSLINQHAGRIRRMVRWAASREMVDASAYNALKTAAGLEAGRGDARETEPVEPVADEIVEQTLPHLPKIVRDLVKLQRLLGCRPAEVCSIWPLALDRRESPWRYTPWSHKCEHSTGRSATRTIFVGPRAQAILKNHLQATPQESMSADSRSCRRPFAACFAQA